MAIFNVRVRHQKISATATAGGYSNYVERARYDEYVGRDGLTHRAKEDLVYTESRNLPDWAKESSDYWKQVDQHTPIGRRAYTEIVVALPKELSDEKNIELSRQYVDQVVGHKYPTTFAIHRPDAANGEPHPHLHVMLSTRRTDLREENGMHKHPEQFFKYHNVKNPERGGVQNDYAQFNTKADIYRLRKAWADTLNPALKEAGIKQEFDYKRDYETEYRKIHLTKGEFRDLQQRVEKLEIEHGVKLWGQERHLTPEMMTQLRQGGMTERQEFKLQRRSDLDAMNEVNRKIQDVVKTYRTERSKELAQELNQRTQRMTRKNGHDGRYLSQDDYRELRRMVMSYEHQNQVVVWGGGRDIAEKHVTALREAGLNNRQLNWLRTYGTDSPPTKAEREGTLSPDLSREQMDNLKFRVGQLEEAHGEKLWNDAHKITPEVMGELRSQGMSDEQAIRLEHKIIYDAKPQVELSKDEYVDMRNRVAAYEKQTGETLLAGTREISQEQLAGLSADGMSARQLDVLRQANSTWSANEWGLRKGTGSSEFDRTPDLKSLVVKVQAALGDDGADRGTHLRRRNRFETVEDRHQQREQSRGLER